MPVIRNTTGLTQFQRGNKWLLITPNGVKFIFDTAEEMVAFAREHWNL
jgi:hypothetical protein